MQGYQMLHANRYKDNDYFRRMQAHQRCLMQHSCVINKTEQPSPIRLQRMRVKMEDTSSLSRRHRTSEPSMAPLKGLSTARVMALAETPATVGRQTHAC